MRLLKPKKFIKKQSELSLLKRFVSFSNNQCNVRTDPLKQHTWDIFRPALLRTLSTGNPIPKFKIVLKSLIFVSSQSFADIISY